LATRAPTSATAEATRLACLLSGWGAGERKGRKGLCLVLGDRLVEEGGRKEVVWDDVATSVGVKEES